MDRSHKINLLVIALLVLAASSLVLYHQVNRFPLPSGETRVVTEDERDLGEEKTQSAALVSDGVDSSSETQDAETMVKSNVDFPEQKRSSRAVLETDGVLHSVPVNDIEGGGPPRDGIPPIDNPKFLTTAEAEKEIADNEPGISVSYDGINRFYPYNILVWHEIVNDIFNGKRILVTYCPLCLSGVAFDPVVEGERVEFGTSGLLWNSNLVMYDRKSDSLWSQVLGEAILGDQTGVILNRVPSDISRFGEWKKAHPGGQVLSRDTGFNRDYARDPYGGYYTDNEAIFFDVDKEDARLANKEFILGLDLNGEQRAYVPGDIKEVREVADTLGGVELTLIYNEELDSVRIFRQGADSKLERVNPIPSFWFAWVAANPETTVYGIDSN